MRIGECEYYLCMSLGTLAGSACVCMYDRIAMRMFIWKWSCERRFALGSQVCGDMFHHSPTLKTRGAHCASRSQDVGVGCSGRECVHGVVLVDAKVRNSCKSNNNSNHTPWASGPLHPSPFGTHSIQAVLAKYVYKYIYIYVYILGKVTTLSFYLLLSSGFPLAQAWHQKMCFRFRSVAFGDVTETRISTLHRARPQAAKC